MMEDLGAKKSEAAIVRNIVICFLLLFALGSVVTCIRERSLKKDGKLVSAKVIDYTLGAGNRTNLTVKFDYNGISYERQAWTSVRSDYWSLLVGRSFPALYTEDEGVIMLLVYPEDFKKYNIKPDSISVWVRDHLMY
ncbi:hypothetical protein LQ567_14110 [Niabella pedocola]|uniref:Uncharacterized protein n=1 Tax=Niabella pedocola TaxID=1752077 RepID=A0ABS8PS48_9BACT|nr:hypothetical protein [Niabella pedocola]MCD2423907.1 hypothetical protein [Niabella pedocola]